MTIQSILLHAASEGCEPHCGPSAFALQLAQACHAAYEGLLDKEETTAEASRQAKDEMRRFVETAGITHDVRANLQTVIATGELENSADRALRDGEFDLLVLGTHGRGGFAHATIGSWASELLNDVASDVLMVRGPRR